MCILQLTFNIPDPLYLRNPRLTQQKISKNNLICIETLYLRHIFAEP